MSEITGERKFIQVEEAANRAAVSESLAFRLGAGLNFINRRQYDTRKIALDGSYWVVTAPQYGVEALEPFPYDIEIFNVAMYNMVPGSGGTTELDVKVTPTSGGTFTSIFTVTPKIASTAGANNYFLKSDENGSNNTAGTGQTMPTWNASMIDGVTGHLNVDAGSALRVDLIQHQTGTPENCGIIIYFRAR